MGTIIDDDVKQKLLDLLAKESPMVISTAYAYAKNYVMYGEDITKAWTTAVQQASIIAQIKTKVQAETYDSFKKDYENLKKDYENRLKADKVAMLEDILMEIKHTVTMEENTSSNEDLVKRNNVMKVVQYRIDRLKENKDAI